jgi:hypothetical protein
MTVRTVIAAIWYWFAQAAGVLLIAGAISFAVLSFFAVEGAVVQTIEGPSDISKTVPYRGTLHYRISTRRNASCPGRLVTSFSYEGGGAPVTVVLSRPIMSTEIKQTNDATIYIQLPENIYPNIYPGRWLYRSIVDSICPTHSQQDVIAQFPFEVTRDVE